VATALADGTDPVIALDALVRRAAVLVRAVREQTANLDPARVRAQVADAEASRARAEALTESLAAVRAERDKIRADAARERDMLHEHYEAQLEAVSELVHAERARAVRAEAFIDALRESVPVGRPRSSGMHEAVRREDGADLQYALLIYRQPGDTDTLSPEEFEVIREEYQAIRREPGMTGGAGLHEADTATTVRLENGKPLVTDGPFADTKEYFAGFYVLEAADLDVATEIAARIPAVRFGGAIEIRPVIVQGQSEIPVQAETPAQAETRGQS
jgi:hypothetical protein